MFQSQLKGFFSSFMTNCPKFICFLLKYSHSNPQACLNCTWYSWGAGSNQPVFHPPLHLTTVHHAGTKGTFRGQDWVTSHYGPDLWNAVYLLKVDECTLLLPFSIEASQHAVGSVWIPQPWQHPSACTVQYLIEFTEKRYKESNILWDMHNRQHPSGI